MILSSEHARRYYEAHAGKQDRQGWYEDAALERLTALGQFEEASRILELGCGTGRFAELLLHSHLAEDAQYQGFDIAPAMLARAGSRLSPFARRVSLKPADVTLGLTAGAGSADRVIATYLFDMLSPAASRNLIAECHRVLQPGGLLCLASLAPQTERGERTILTQLWTLVQRYWPWIVGGCRPVELHRLFAGEPWEIIARETVSPRGLTSEILVARRL